MTLQMGWTRTHMYSVTYTGAECLNLSAEQSALYPYFSGSFVEGRFDMLVSQTIHY